MSNKTFQYARFDIEHYQPNPDLNYAHIANGEGAYVLAEDAINREAVNADRIRLLELQLKEITAKSNKNHALYKDALDYINELEK